MPNFCAETLTTQEYEKISNQTLDGICEYFEEINDENLDLKGFDCEYSVC